jgi:hypothetical protein
MRSLAEIVRANQEAEKLGIKTAFNPVGVDEAKPVNPAVLTPARMRALGLDKY